MGLRGQRAGPEVTSEDDTERFEAFVLDVETWSRPLQQVMSLPDH